MIPTSTIRDLTITLLRWRSEANAPPSGFAENVATFFSFLTNWTPYLQVLHVTSPTQAKIISYAESLRGLSVIHLNLNGILDPPSEQQAGQATHISDFKSDEVKFSGFSEVFTQCSGREASKLNVSFRGAVSTIRTIFNPNLWINLRTLEFGTHPRDWSGISLPYVRKLTLADSVTSSDPTAISSLCKELASDTTTFPSLETLETISVPEWDILMLMLERRNCRLDHNATRIESLLLGTIPPLFILRPLTQVLRGELPIYDSLEEMSLYGISKVYHNPSV
jgi:hypothetical protein